MTLLQTTENSTMEDAAADPMVRLEGVTKTYERGRERVEVLKKLNLVVAEGDFLALMGPSGSGKTTLLNMLGGIDRPTSGDVRVMGQSLNGMSEAALTRWRAQRVGLVFQLHHLLPRLTAEENVALPLVLTGLNASERRRRALGALALVGLADRARHKPRELSGGQQQRVGIARAIVTDPAILLCDEPTGDLDRRAGDQVLHLLRLLNTEHGKTIIMVTHDPRAAASAQRTLFVDKGVLSEEPQVAP